MEIEQSVKGLSSIAFVFLLSCMSCFYLISNMSKKCSGQIPPVKEDTPWAYISISSGSEKKTVFLQYSGPQYWVLFILKWNFLTSMNCTYLCGESIQPILPWGCDFHTALCCSLTSSLRAAEAWMQLSEKVLSCTYVSVCVYTHIHVQIDTCCSNLDLDNPVCWNIQQRSPPQVFPQRLSHACTCVFPSGWQEQL